MRWILATAIALLFLYGSLDADDLPISEQLAITSYFSAELDHEIKKMELQITYHTGLLKIYTDHFGEVMNYKGTKESHECVPD